MMIRSLLVGCLVLVGVFLPATEFLHEQRLSLDGPWRFTTDPTQPEDRWDTLTVPGNWDAQPAYANHRGEGHYQRPISVPTDWAGRRIRLRFEAVYHDAVVRLDGVEIGRHSGGYTPFECDVTARLVPGRPSQLSVVADNRYRRGAWWPWGGISRSVHLIATGDVRIVWQHIRTEPDLKTGSARVVVRYRLANDGAAARSVRLQGTVEGDSASVAAEVLMQPRSTTEVDAETRVDHALLWDFDHPHLYRLSTVLLEGGAAVHQVVDRFGIRRVELVPDGLLLNGERVRLCGFNRVADSRATGATEPEAMVRRDVALMKRANGNLTRLMHHAQAPALLDALDDQGMLIWCEIPIWGRGDPLMSDPADRRPEAWMQAMIDRDYNHPCIIGWSVGNEMEGHFAYTQRMQAFTQALDPHRIVTHVSYTGQRRGIDPAQDPISISPVAMINTYVNGKVVDVVHQRWPGKPIFFSEFGMRQFGNGLEARIDGLEAMFAAATQGHPEVIGVSLWTFNDYRSDYPKTPPSGDRAWGIVDDQRRPKQAYDQVRTLFSPVHRLTVAAGVVRIEPRAPTEVPSFTLRGYRLTWEGGEVAVPDLRPGDPPWSASVSAAPGTTISLRNPLGYDVADCR